LRARGRVIDRGLAADHRLVRFVATISDRSGGIADLAEVVPLARRHTLCSSGERGIPGIFYLENMKSACRPHAINQNTI
jgi:hypothetical protein